MFDSKYDTYDSQIWLKSWKQSPDGADELRILTYKAVSVQDHLKNYQSLAPWKQTKEMKADSKPLHRL